VQSTPHQRRRSVILVFCCTLIGAAAQVLIKSGANDLGPYDSILSTVRGILNNYSLLAGYSLYGINTCAAGAGAAGIANSRCSIR
jgi:hypothetical protein